MTIETAERLVKGFENCTLPKEEWTHEAHFVMAFWVCLQWPLPLAVNKIREGIKKYNISVGGQNTGSAGYHETITLLYTYTIARYIVTGGVTSFTQQSVAALLAQPFIAKDYPLNFYSKEALFSKQARLQWVEPAVN
ncbi:MAG TPA: hypothetical protein VG738_10265 [Chitinophagaceae bacterium]|nr:hypothetical protein [Chitinophagaceae bacterium]